jgi:hypothetical protein
LTTYFAQSPDQQFGRRFWMPPHSVRSGWFLVKTPPSDGREADGEAKPLHSMSIRRHGSIEASAEPRFGERSESTYIRCRKNPSTTLLIAGRGDKEAERFVAAARANVRNPDSFLVSASGWLPPDETALDQWTHIALATDRILGEPASVEALRQWVMGGGKLWILLDQTGPEAALPFLSDAGGLTVVDRVGLTSISLTGSSMEFLTTGQVREVEEPVEMIRVVSQGFRSLCQVEGWDAAFLTEVGRGTVLVTTLSPRGWLQSREETTRWHSGLSEDSYPTEECLSLGDLYWGGERTKTELDIAGIATSYVGYRVTSLIWVATALALFCVTVLISSLVLWRADRLTWLAGFAPAASVLAALCIGITGYWEKTAIPPTEALIQVAEADSLGNVRLEGGISVYSVSTGDTLPDVTQGGRLEFLEPPVGTAKRLVWSDYGRTHWENLSLNTGVHEFRFEAFEAREPSVAVLSLNDRGVTGRIAGGGWELPPRGLIISPGGRFAAPRFFDEGHFESSAAESLPPGQFSASDVIDDREVTRMEVLRAYFSGGRPLPPEPRLYFWTKPLNTGMRIQSEGRRVGDALVGLPIVIEAPPRGASLYCPPYLIGYRSVLHSGRGSSLAYNNRTHQWNDLLLREGKTTLEFRLPAGLGPFELNRLRLYVDLNAPDRTFQLLSLDQSKPQEIQELARRNSPVGLMEFELEGDNLPPLDDDFAFRLGFDIGPLLDDAAQEMEADRARHSWQFRNVWIEAWAKTPE